MARSQVDLPRMQNQPRLRGAEARGPQLVTGAGDATPSSPRKPQLMRQFELVDRVKEYNPKANEELLNAAIDAGTHEGLVEIHLRLRPCGLGTCLLGRQQRGDSQR